MMAIIINIAPDTNWRTSVSFCGNEKTRIPNRNVINP